VVVGVRKDCVKMMLKLLLEKKKKMKERKERENVDKKTLKKKKRKEDEEKKEETSEETSDNDIDTPPFFSIYTILSFLLPPVPLYSFISTPPPFRSLFPHFTNYETLVNEWKISRGLQIDSIQQQPSGKKESINTQKSKNSTTSSSSISSHTSVIVSPSCFSTSSLHPLHPACFIKLWNCKNLTAVEIQQHLFPFAGVKEKKNEMMKE
jgi:hypothetical protein